jgi:hypothetical protein
MVGVRRGSFYHGLVTTPRGGERDFQAHAAHRQGALLVYVTCRFPLPEIRYANCGTFVQKPAVMLAEESIERGDHAVLAPNILLGCG